MDWLAIPERLYGPTALIRLFSLLYWGRNLYGDGIVWVRMTCIGWAFCRFL